RRSLSLEAPLPQIRKAPGQVRHPPLDAKPRGGPFPRPVLSANGPPAQPGLRARNPLDRLCSSDGTGIAPPPGRHLPHLHVLLLREGRSRSALHRLPPPTFLS